MIIIIASIIGIFGGWMIVSSLAVAREDTVLEDLLLGIIGGIVGILAYQLLDNSQIIPSVSVVCALVGSVLFTYTGRKILSVASPHKYSSHTTGY